MAESIEQIERRFHAEIGRIGDHLESLKDGVRGAGGAGQLPAEVMDEFYAAYEEADAAYLEAAETRNRKLEERAGQLRQQLFGVPEGAAGPAFTNALTQAANADEDQLRTLAELAAKSGGSTLGKAAFVVATERGMADLGLAWLEAHPEAREAFRELGTMPTPAEREQALDFRWPRPTFDTLKPSPQDILGNNQVMAVRRAQNGPRLAG